MNQPYARVNQPYATLTLASALREMFGVQLYKNNARALLSRILSILNLDWLQHARSVRGVYECIMLVAWDTRDGDEILTSLNYPWDRCDPVWRSGKVLDWTWRGPGFNSSMGPDFFTISIQCVLVSQCFIIYLILLTFT